MVKVAIVVTYFGKLPILTRYWAKSCEYNKGYDFYLITNDSKPSFLPDNVSYIPSSLDDFKKRVKEKLDIECNVKDKPYKTCDFRPLISLLYDEFFKGYDYVGQCELDMFFGRIDHFLSDKIFRKGYQRLMTYGHFSIYKNDDFLLNHLEDRFGGGYTFRELLEKGELCNADEQYHQYSINTLFDELNESIYEDANPYIADIFQTHKRFIVSEHRDRKTIRYKEKMVFTWDNGCIYGHILRNEKIREKEYIYIHLQKRRMVDAIQADELPDKWLIIPNVIEPYQTVTRELIEKNSKESIFYRQWYQSHIDGLKLRIYRLRTGDMASCEVGVYKK